MTKTIREGAGCYTVYHGELKVTVVRNPEIQGYAKWIAYANWDKYLVADPVETKTEAVAVAKGFIRARLTEEFIRERVTQ
jgi:hypothetical protein